MLRDDEKSLIRISVEALRNGLDGFTPRRPQLEMIAAVANAIGGCHEPEDTNRQGRNIAVVEAGTGTGKTIGYLLDSKSTVFLCQRCKWMPPPYFRIPRTQYY